MPGKEHAVWGNRELEARELYLVERGQVSGDIRIRNLEQPPHPGHEAMLGKPEVVKALAAIWTHVHGDDGEPCQPTSRP